jgi:hypothetical protein
LFLSWCFDVLTKNLNSHLLTCHRLPTTPRRPPTPSDRLIPLNTSSTRGKRNLEVRNGWQVYLPDTFRLLNFSFFHLHCTGGMLQNAPRTQPTLLPTHQSPRIHQQQGVDGIWRLFVEEKWVGEVRAEVKNNCLLFFVFGISPPLGDCCSCVNNNTQQSTTRNAKQQQSKQQTHNNQPSNDVLLCLRRLRRVSCFLFPIFCSINSHNIIVHPTLARE